MRFKLLIPEQKSTNFPEHKVSARIGSDSCSWLHDSMTHRPDNSSYVYQHNALVVHRCPSENEQFGILRCSKYLTNKGLIFRKRSQRCALKPSNCKLPYLPSPAKEPIIDGTTISNIPCVSNILQLPSWGPTTTNTAITSWEWVKRFKWSFF